MKQTVKISDWYDLSLIPLASLRKHERHDQEKVNALINQINLAGIWSHPIIVDQEYHIILDGHHRYEAACRMGLSYIPCAVIDYDNERIAVDAWREGEIIDRHAVRNAALSGQLMPIHTSRHKFSEPIKSEEIPLEYLYERELAYA